MFSFQAHPKLKIISTAESSLQEATQCIFDQLISQLWVVELLINANFTRCICIFEGTSKNNISSLLKTPQQRQCSTGFLYRYATLYPLPDTTRIIVPIYRFSVRIAVSLFNTGFLVILRYRYTDTTILRDTPYCFIDCPKMYR